MLIKDAVKVGAGDSSDDILEDLWNREKELPTAVGKELLFHIVEVNLLSLLNCYSIA